METCCENAPAVAQLPAKEKNLYKFKNLAATWFVRLVIYFDLQFFLCRVAGARPIGATPTPELLKNTSPVGFHQR